MDPWTTLTINKDLSTGAVSYKRDLDTFPPPPALLPSLVACALPKFNPSKLSIARSLKPRDQEAPYLAQEVAAYRHLSTTPGARLAPKLLRDVYEVEPRRVTGILIELLQGRHLSGR
ncbi:hypothetical protein N0V88_002888 [Collariella sp. IMI 366227]|nr:hypothetical protein N0V88_002888 [Collariella sp. IMI 366227]